jgi:hypothetical protein
MAKQKVATITIDFSGARAFVRELQSGGSNTTKGHRRAAEKYRGWLQKRYQKNAMGGGEWPDLAPSTIKRKKRNKHVILVEYMNLYNALSVRRLGKNQYTVGIFSSAPARRSNKSLRQIATIHQQGRGVPRRRIVVMPSSQMLVSMRNEIQKGINQDIRKTNRGSK